MKRKDLKVGQEVALVEQARNGYVDTHHAVTRVKILATEPYVKNNEFYRYAGITLDGTEYAVSSYEKVKAGRNVLVVNAVTDRVELARLDRLFGPTYGDVIAAQEQKRAEELAQHQEWAVEKAADEKLREEVIGALGLASAHYDWTNHRMVIIDVRVLADLMRAAGRL